MVNKIIKTIKQFEYEYKSEDKVIVKMETLSTLKDEINHLWSVLGAREDKIQELQFQVKCLTSKLIEKELEYPFLDIRG